MYPKFDYGEPRDANETRAPAATAKSVGASSGRKTNRFRFPPGSEKAGLLAAGFLVLTIFGPGVRAGEMVLYDGVLTMTAADRGFKYFRPAPSAGGDWLTPNNFYEGEIHLRYEVRDYPSARPFQLSVCIWADVVQEAGRWKSWKETCPVQTPISGKGVFTQSSSPATWWCLKREPVDFKRVADFKWLGLVLWSDDRRNMSDLTPPAKSSWDQAKDFLPLTVRVTLIGIPKGSAFSGWERHLARIDSAAR